MALETSVSTEAPFDNILKVLTTKGRSGSSVGTPGDPCEADPPSEWWSLRDARSALIPRYEFYGEILTDVMETLVVVEDGDRAEEGNRAEVTRDRCRKHCAARDRPRVGGV